MIVTILLFILILGIIIFVHELGHFIFAKIAGVHVHEFALGFGPVLLKKKAKDGTQYAIRAIPLGGFVSMAGEEVNIDREKNKGKNLQDKTLFQRLLIMFMGVGFNFVFAFLILLISGFIYGATDMRPIITDVVENTPAAIAGLEKGDQILRINDQKITYKDDIAIFMKLAIVDIEKKTETKTDEAIVFDVKKIDGTENKYSVFPTKTVENGENVYKIGIGYGSIEVKKDFFSVIKYSFLQEGAMFKQMFVVLESLFTGKLSIKELSGPVGIFSIVGDAKKYGLSSILYLVAFLSINVGVINLLPFPAFDGGRILFLLIEKVKGSPVNPKTENIIHTIGFLLLIALMIYITFNDILKLF